MPIDTITVFFLLLFLIHFYLFRFNVFKIWCSNVGAYTFTSLYFLTKLIPWSYCSTLCLYSCCLKVYFVWYKYSYTCSLLVYICMEYIFPYLLSICMFLYWWSEIFTGSILLDFLFIKSNSASFYLLIGKFNPFKFMVNIDIWKLMFISLFLSLTLKTLLFFFWMFWISFSFISLYLSLRFSVFLYWIDWIFFLFLSLLF